MALRGIRLNLALLALASSSGYLLFYLAPDSGSALLSRDALRWSRFVVETPVEISVPTASKPVQQPLFDPQVEGRVLVLSGHRNNGGFSVPAAVQPPPAAVTRDSKPVVTMPAALSDPAPTEPTGGYALPQVDEFPAPVSAKPGGLVAILSHPGKKPSSSPGKQENQTAYMDTSLLLTGLGNSNDPQWGLGPSSTLNSVSEEDFDDPRHSPWDTTAGRLSPGESLGDELNLATRAYIANTAEHQYQVRMGFVVDRPKAELMIYALATNLRDNAQRGPELPPRLQIYDATGERVAGSESPQSEQAKDPAVIHVFSPGVYQVVVTAAEGSAGEVVVGVKDFYSVEVE